MQARVQNLLAAVRRSRGVSAAELAKKVGISRQTIYAIEAGTYIPNTEVTLRLAHQLEVKVEEIFSLHDDRTANPESVTAEALSARPLAKGQAVRLCEVGARLVAAPVSATPYYLAEADGVVSKAARAAGKADLTVLAREEGFQRRVVLAGCDPATSLLTRMVERISGVEVVPAPASSKLALEWLRGDRVHIAGSHLRDTASGEFNLPYLRQEFAGEDLKVITFARWEEGLVLAAGNPRELNGVSDLARRGVSFVNREPGSGSRDLVDRLLRDAGVPAAKVKGYQRIAYGHLAAAYLVMTGEADCCIATRSAARAFGLDFIPIHCERYDLVMRRKTLELPAVEAFFDVLQRATLRRKLEVLAGYDTAETGSVLI